FRQRGEQEVLRVPPRRVASERFVGRREDRRLSLDLERDIAPVVAVPAGAGSGVSRPGGRQRVAMCPEYMVSHAVSLPATRMTRIASRHPGYPGQRRYAWGVPETLTVQDAVELAVVERNGFVESRHAGAAVVLSAAGEVVGRYGNTDALILPR